MVWEDNIGRLNEEYKLENALPLVGLFCAAVKVKLVPLFCDHPLTENGVITVLILFD